LNKPAAGRPAEIEATMLILDSALYRRSADGFALVFHPHTMGIFSPKTPLVEITPLRILIRETAAFYGGRPLVIELHPRFLRIREKQRRRGYDVSYKEIARYCLLRRSPNFAGDNLFHFSTISYGQIYRIGAFAVAERARRERYLRPKNFQRGGLSRESARPGRSSIETG
jgi:hypothetical protein